MKTKHDIMLDVAKMAGTRYLIRALLFVKSFVVMRVLGPAGQGLVTQITLIQTYGTYTDLGLNGALTRGLPVLGDSPEEETRRQAMIDTCFTSTALVCVLVVGGVLLSSLRGNSSDVTRSLILMAGVVLLQAVFRFFENLLRVRHEIDTITRAYATLELSGLVLTVTLTWFMGVTGYFLALFLANALVAAFVASRFRQSGARLGWRLDLKLTGKMILAGFPLASTTFLYVSFLSLDRLVMSWTMSDAQVGQYSLALLIAGVILFIPDSIGYVLFPHLRQRSAQAEGDPAALERYLREPTEILAWVIPFFIAGAMLALPAVPLILPAYRPGLEPARVLTLFTFFLAINSVAQSHLVAFKENWRSLLGLQVVVYGVSVAMVVAAIQLGYGVPGVAWAVGIAYLLYGLGSQGLALYTCGLGPGRIAADLLRVCLPFLYVVPVLRGIEALIHHFALSGIPAVAAGVALFIPASAPLLWGLARRTPLLELAGRVVRKVRGQ